MLFSLSLGMYSTLLFLFACNVLVLSGFSTASRRGNRGKVKILKQRLLLGSELIIIS